MTNFSLPVFASKSAAGWVALMIGNSRLHWAQFEDQEVVRAWDTPHLDGEAIATLIQNSFNPDACTAASAQPCKSELWLASVVPSQTELWRVYPHSRHVMLEHIPLHGLYPTLGVDRALALLGAVHSIGAPVLVVDGGTALTFTAADASHMLIGGAILPGLQLQMRSLTQHTAALPSVVVTMTDRPDRWATNTPDAIRSGVVYTLLAGIRDYLNAWWGDHPGSAVIFTGGDGRWLYQHATQIYPAKTAPLHHDPHLIFKGIHIYRQNAAQTLPLP